MLFLEERQDHAESTRFFVITMIPNLLVDLWTLLARTSRLHFDLLVVGLRRRIWQRFTPQACQPPFPKALGIPCFLQLILLPLKTRLPVDPHLHHEHPAIVGGPDLFLVTLSSMYVPASSNTTPPSSRSSRPCLLRIPGRWCSWSRPLDWQPETSSLPNSEWVPWSQPRTPRPSCSRLPPWSRCCSARLSGFGVQCELILFPAVVGVDCVHVVWLDLPEHFQWGWRYSCSRWTL